MGQYVPNEWDELYDSFIGKMNALQMTYPVSLTVAQEAVDIAIEHLHKLKKLVIDHQFASEEEEVKFFKYYKPRFHSQLIYFNKLFNIELKKPLAGKSALEEYYQKQLFGIKLFFEGHQDIYQYFRRNDNSLDDKFFIRGNTLNKKTLHHRHPDVDARFSTDQDYLFSQIMANERLSHYLQLCLDSINNIAPSIPPPPSNRKTLIWTDSKTDFVEFIYGLFAKRCCNNGDITKKDLFDILSPVFSIMINNTSRVWQEVLSRKKPYRNFYNKTGDSLQNEIENDDD